MLPPDLAALRARLDAAVKEHDVGAISAEITKAAEPQIVLFEHGGGGSLGAVHEAARKLDPSIPADFQKAMRDPGLDVMEQLVKAHEYDAVKPGDPRVGGVPDLPPGVDWPTHNGKHLTFVAQVDLSTLPRWKDCPLPAAGWLWFFAAGDFPIASTVLHWEGNAAALQRRPTPPDDSMLLGEYVRKPQYKLIRLRGAEVIANVPTYGSDWWTEHVQDDEDLADRMVGFIEQVHAPEKEDEQDIAAGVLGRLGMGDETPTELAVNWGNKKGDDWILLLEIRSSGGMNWSDAGTLSFLIRAPALKARDFSDTYALISSS